MLAMVEALPAAPGDLKQELLWEETLRLAPFRLNHLPPGMVLGFDVFIPSMDHPGKVVRAWPKGGTFPGDTEDLGWGYFAVPDTAAVLDCLWSRISEADSQPEEVSLSLLTDTLLVWIQHFYLNEEARTPDRLELARNLIRRWLHLWEGLSCPFFTLEALRRHDSGVFSHCLNVGLLGLAFSPHFSESQTERVEFAVGAFLHDLGMMAQSSEVFYLTGPLSDDDWEKIKQHPDLGADLLQSLGGMAEPLLLMVRQHHENLDGSGYPAGLAGEAIHPWARILKILDSYEAITSLRPWRPPLGRRQALHVMTSAWSSQNSYDPHYLSLFLDFCQGKTPPRDAPEKWKEI